MKKIIKLFLVIILGVSLVGCFNFNLTIPDGTPNENNEDVPVSVVLTSENNIYKLYVDETLKINAIINPSTVTEPVQFTSSDENIATVNSEGIVTGKKAGTVKITGTVSKKISSTKTKTVEGYIILTVLDKQIDIESVEIVGPTVVYVDEVIKYNLVKVPENANVKGTWSVDNESIAIIDENGRLKAVSTGVIEIKYQVNETIFSVLEVTINSRENAPESIEIAVREIIEVGENVKAYIISYPRETTNQVEWSSSDNLIASINEDGIITGISEGKVIIYAKHNDEITAEIEIEVKDYSINTDNLEDNIVDIVRTKKESVIGVSNYKKNIDGKLVRSSLGSGFIYKVQFILKDGSVINSIDEIRSFKEVEYFKYYVVTNRHVVEGSDEIKVYLHEEDIEVNATLLQYDDKEDVGVISFNYTRYFKPLDFADSDKLEAGRFAIAIGNPNGYEFSSSATFGIISHPKRYLPTDTDDDGVRDWDAEYIQHDVAINPGNSGGPLFNLKGEVIGVNTLKYVSSDIENMGFSIPSNVVKKLLPYLENGERPVRAKLGITSVAVKDILANPSSEYSIPEEINHGLYVINVVEGSAAELGGIKANDIIISFNNIQLRDATTLRAELNKIVVGSNTHIEVVVYRSGSYVTLILTW